MSQISLSELQAITSRFAMREQSQRLLHAVELLGGIELPQRLAGIALLSALLRESQGKETARMRETILDVLGTFVRERTHWLPGLAAPKMQPDTQAALSALTQKQEDGGRPLDLHGAYLREVYLPLAHLPGAFLYDCDLEGALLIGADLSRAWLWRANLHRANLDEANLCGADLSNARGLTDEQLRSARWDENTRWPVPEKSSGWRRFQ